MVGVRVVKADDILVMVSCVLIGRSVILRSDRVAPFPVGLLTVGHSMDAHAFIHGAGFTQQKTATLFRIRCFRMLSDCVQNVFCCFHLSSKLSAKVAQPSV